MHYKSFERLLIARIGLPIKRQIALAENSRRAARRRR